MASDRQARTCNREYTPFFIDSYAQTSRVVGSEGSIPLNLELFQHPSLERKLARRYRQVQPQKLTEFASEYLYRSGSSSVCRLSAGRKTGVLNHGDLAGLKEHYKLDGIYLNKPGR